MNYNTWIYTNYIIIYIEKIIEKKICYPLNKGLQSIRKLVFLVYKLITF